MDLWNNQSIEADLVVCGGGLAGLCAAIAAARHGSKVVLLHDRTVLGGNSSSEVRVTPHGAAQFHAYGRETGIISELLIEERARNHAWIMENGWTNSVWDLVQLEAVKAEPNITLYLNTKVTAAHTTGGAGRDDVPRISHVEALVLDSEIRLTASAPLFLDATGDGLVAAAAGCEVMLGSEARTTHDEPHAPEAASSDTMGNSLHFKTEEVGHETAFSPPPWARDLRDPHFFYGSGRTPSDPRGGFWWIELGSPHDTIHDNPYLRDELTSWVLGIWDWMKNHDPKLADATRTRSLDWVGSVLGTRESRRIVGNTLVTEKEIQAKKVWDDEVAYGGWFLDLHTPGGLIAEHSEANSATNYNPFTERAALGYVGPYGIPLSALVARDVSNLFLAGRNISGTHAALGTMRVMGTTALMGQAVGTAAAQCRDRGCDPKNLQADDVRTIQQTLLRDGVWLPDVVAADQADRARSAAVSASSCRKLTGIGPDEPGYAEAQDMIDERINLDLLKRVDNRMAQVIATDGSLEAVALCVSNHAAAPTEAVLTLQLCDHIHDYTVYPAERAVSSACVTVPPGSEQWISWQLPADARDAIANAVRESGAPQRYLRLELAANTDLQWHYARTCLPAHPAMYEVALNRMRRFQHGLSLAFRVSPSQDVYSASEVVSGVARPRARTNLWLSDPSQAGPAWVELCWPTAQTIQEVHLTFPGHLLREYHAYHPFYRAPETARDYEIQTPDPGKDGEWVSLLRVEENYQRRRVHRLSTPVQADRLRVVIHATNGEPSAGLYEVRVY